MCCEHRAHIVLKICETALVVRQEIKTFEICMKNEIHLILRDLVILLDNVAIKVNYDRMYSFMLRNIVAWVMDTSTRSRACFVKLNQFFNSPI